MGIGRYIEEPPAPTKVAKLRQHFEPVVLSYKKFYQTNPQEALTLYLTILLLCGTLIIENFHPLTWYWYAILAIWLLGFFNFKQLFKKIRRWKSKKSLPNKK
jgi:hypothetical protein